MGTTTQSTNAVGDTPENRTRRRLWRSGFVLGLAAFLVAACAAPTEDGGDEDDDGDDPSAEVDSSLATNVTAKALLAKLKGCKKVSKAPYALDANGRANVDVCGLDGAVYFKADLDIDCDGKQSAACNRRTDPYFQSQTAATDSKGRPLDAAALPFVVVPGVSSRWSYKASGIQMGSVAAVIYKDKIVYGIVGDVGPQAIIGEASYAMAKQLGINPNPKTGGVASGVTYIIFTGKNAVVKKREDHAEAVKLGKKLASKLIEGS